MGSDDSAWSGPGEPLVFDDEPLEAILYGASTTGPTPADLFAESRPRIDAIRAAIAGGRDEDALRAMQALYGGDIAVPEAIAPELVQFIGRFIPQVPCPLAVEHGVPYDAILGPIFERAVALDHQPLADAAGTLLYRWHEACARYADARAVISTLLARALKRGGVAEEAGLTNNLAYECLLEGDWAPAEPLLVHAVELAEGAGSATEIANMRANLLTCRIGQVGLSGAKALEPEIEAARKTLAEHKDWRERKLLLLQARILDHRGDLKQAIERMERAVRGAKDVPSRHRLEDEAYLARLGQRPQEGALRRGELSVQAPADAGRGNPAVDSSTSVPADE